MTDVGPNNPPENAIIDDTPDTDDAPQVHGVWEGDTGGGGGGDYVPPTPTGLTMNYRGTLGLHDGVMPGDVSDAGDGAINIWLNEVDDLSTVQDSDFLAVGGFPLLVSGNGHRWTLTIADDGTITAVDIDA